MKIQGYGSIVPLEDKPNRLCRKWQLRPKSFTDPKTGKRVFPPTATFNGTLTEATEALKRMVDGTGKARTKKKTVTVEDVGAEWLEERKLAAEVSQDTLEKYETHLNILYHHMRALPIMKVTHKHLLLMFSACREGDSPSGKPLSNTYLKSARVTYNMFFAWAKKEGYLLVNPIDEVPVPKEDTKERRALKLSEREDFLQRLNPHVPADVLAALAVEAGYRRKEMTYSIWGYMDLLNAEALIAGTKTPSSFAITALSPFLVQFLLEWKEYQRRKLEEIGLEQTDKTPVIATMFGDFYAPNSIDRIWAQRRDELGLPPDFLLHELRHTFSTTLARKKIHPRMIQDLMRHADGRMSQEVYTHVDIDDLKWAVSQLDSGVLKSV